MMRRSGFMIGIVFILLPSLVFLHKTVLGYDITDEFSVGAVVCGAYQHQWVNGDEDKGRGALPFQAELSVRPTERNELSAKFGFADGNGLNGITDFNLAPWAADLEDDVKDLNGRNRDHLLTAWYNHTFVFGDNNTLALTGGIIDSTDYIDENVYANDEYTQFMNEALVNGPNGFSPSYDSGGAVVWEIGNWAIKTVGMNVGENDDGNNYNFFGTQIGYKANTPLGEGNYRLTVNGTSEAFLDEDGNEENLFCAMFSFDQALGEIFGAWIRFGWQDDEALISCDALYSGGLNITGVWYGREDDNIGIGYAYLKGKYDFDHMQVAEIYWRFVLNDYCAVTADLQYVEYEYDIDHDGVDGFIGGVRMTVEF